VPTPRHASHAASDPVETVTPPSSQPHNLTAALRSRGEGVGWVPHGAEWLVLQCLFYAEKQFAVGSSQLLLSERSVRITVNYEPGTASLLFEVDRFVLVAGDAGADLGGRFAQPGLLVGVEALLGAGGAFSAVERLKATAQAGVAQRAIAAAVAGQLVGHAADFGNVLVDMHLPGITEVGTGEL
jgi:hypothetical protein